MTEPAEIGKATSTIEDGHNEFVIYSNLASVLTTPEEVIIHFAQRRPKSHTKGIGIGKVYLSIWHAKRLTAVLARVIKAYEEQFGEIIAEPEERFTIERRKRGADERLESRDDRDE